MSLTNNLPPTKYSFQITSRDQLNALSFAQLSQYRSQLDSDLTLLFQHLQYELNADMNMSLLTLDGFPRADIDVVQIRLCRAKIIKLQNDYKWISETLLDKMKSQLDAST
jgi:26S proteasome non-ATPase regulatory subunit 9